jgi:energy-coupling factor transporter ATP-binding protein EcfA2
LTGTLDRAGSEVADVTALIDRLTAVQRFLRAADGIVPDDRLVAAHTLLERAGDRLALSGGHTVVALAGSTGSGKSSLFNALARLYLSPVGVRRPTTGEVYALVWGPLEDAGPLLDWIGVLPRHRLARESALDGNDEARLHGLILLDLPDFDSLERTHRVQVDRLLGLVDLVVWVVDPQKYADNVLHDHYLRQFRRHGEVTVVVLNQADRLAPDDVRRCLADLRRLLDEDGLAEVPTLATSAHQPQALAELHELLEREVAARQAALRRLAGDVANVAAGLAGLVGPPVAEDAVDRGSVRMLTNALATTAGVPAMVAATERAYRDRADATMGWLPARLLRRLRADPWRRLRLKSLPAAPLATGADHSGAAARSGAPAGAGAAGAGPAGRATWNAWSSPDRPPRATGVPPMEPAQNSALGMAVRGLADRAGAQLPEPWSAAVTRAARSRLADLPDALDRAVGRTVPDVLGSPRWWWVAAAIQWLAAAAALFGVLWLAVGAILRALVLSTAAYPAAGGLPLPVALLVGGVLGGLLVTVLLRPVVGFAARRAGVRADRVLRFAVAEVGREYVVAPVRQVLHRYAEAREALAAARGSAPARQR